LGSGGVVVHSGIDSGNDSNNICGENKGISDTLCINKMAMIEIACPIIIHTEQFAVFLIRLALYIKINMLYVYT